MITPKPKIVIRKNDLYHFRRKIFMENVDLQELFFVEEYNHLTKEFEITIAFKTQNDRNRYINLINNGLSVLRVRPIKRKLSLVLNEEKFNIKICELNK